MRKRAHKGPAPGKISLFEACLVLYVLKRIPLMTLFHRYFWMFSWWYFSHCAIFGVMLAWFVSLMFALFFMCSSKVWFSLSIVFPTSFACFSISSVHLLSIGSQISQLISMSFRDAFRIMICLCLAPVLCANIEPKLVGNTILSENHTFDENMKNNANMRLTNHANITPKMTQCEKSHHENIQK